MPEIKEDDLKIGQYCAIMIRIKCANWFRPRHILVKYYCNQFQPLWIFSYQAVALWKCENNIEVVNMTILALHHRQNLQNIS